MEHINNESALHLRFMQYQGYAVQFWTIRIVLVEATLKHHIVCEHKHLFLVRYPLYHPLL